MMATRHATAARVSAAQTKHLSTLSPRRDRACPAMTKDGLRGRQAYPAVICSRS